MYLSYAPLWHTDLWGHVAYGHWMLDSGTLPEFDPFVELANATPLVASAWMSQVLFGAAERGGGPEWLSCVFAVASVTVYVTLGLVFFQQTSRLSLALLGSILTWLICWDRHLVLRPELLGSVLFAVLLMLLSAARLPAFNSDVQKQRYSEASAIRLWSIRCIVGLLFVIWANAHGSFVVGLILLSVIATAAVFGAWRRDYSFLATIREPQTKQPLVLCLIAAGATLVNPYGIVLWLHVISFASNPNLSTISEWQPPGLTSMTGLAVLLSTTVFAATLKFRRHNQMPAEWGLFVLFTTAVCLRERMVTWYAPVIVFLMMPGIHGLLDRFESSALMMRMQAMTSQRSRIQTALMILFVWLAFVFSPISQPVLGGRLRTETQLYRDQTPIGITKFLRETTPTERIANPQWWGDWLLWDGPPGLRVTMTTNTIHLLPPQHSEQLHAISWAKPPLAERLDAYNVELLVVDTERQIDLATYIRRSSDWRINYEDAHGIVASKRQEH
jgi:hypothetical protein